MDSTDKTAVQIMEWLEKYGYVTAGLSFLLLAMAVFFYGWVQFFQTMLTGLQSSVLMLLNDLLLVVILLELFRTVINFLKTRVVSLDPFLHVGIIAAVRRILMVGAQMALQSDVSAEQLRLGLWDTGVNALTVIVLVAALYLYRLNRPAPAIEQG